MKDTHCETCRELHYKIKKQEEYIAQLVEIVAVTNRKVTDIDLRQRKVEREALLR